MSVEALVKQIEELPEEQRGELFDRLDDLYGEPGERIELTDEMRALLEERNAKYEANPTNLVSWEHVLESLRRKQ